MTELTVKVLVSYLLGSVIGSLVVGRLRGVDIRTLGSGNAGSTNALRTQGKAFALAVIVIDIGKGWIATGLWAPALLPGLPAAEAGLRAWLPAACGAAVIIGHVYPLWFGLRGGKGVATLIGAVLGIAPWLLVPVLAAWLIVVVLSGFVGLASIVAAIVLPVSIALGVPAPRAPLLAFGVFVAVVVVFTHRRNIARMLAGVEPHAHRLWLLGRRQDRPRV